VPDNPEGWIVTTARRLQIDRARSAQVAGHATAQMLMLEEERTALREEGGRDGDDLMKLLFVCAHPAIGARERTPLMLQVVLGLDARRIASAFLVAPGTMGQRLSRTKAKIATAGIAFEIPPPEAYPARLASVLDAIYAAYTLGWDNAHTDDARTNALSQEAVWLGSLVADLLPEEGEAHGLLALMLYGESRRDARRDATSGAFVALADQDVARWNQAMIEDAETALRNGARVGAAAPGRYQIEAAIQAVHATRRTSGGTDWAAIALLYEGLLRITPNVGARTAAAAALSEAEGPNAGLAALEAIEAAVCRSYQPWWTLRGHLMTRLGRPGEARTAFETAAGLTEDAAVRAYLLARRSDLFEE
jgi:RNA polymerase sigma-70 factor (ECF subfamily)